MGRGGGGERETSSLHIRTLSVFSEGVLKKREIKEERGGKREAGKR